MTASLSLTGSETTKANHYWLASARQLPNPVRSGVAIEDALSETREIEARRLAAGFDQQALEQAAREALANGAFEDSEDEDAEVVEEFFNQEPEQRGVANAERTASESRPLIDKLGEKMGQREQAH